MKKLTWKKNHRSHQAKSSIIALVWLRFKCLPRLWESQIAYQVQQQRPCIIHVQVSDQRLPIPPSSSKLLQASPTSFKVFNSSKLLQTLATPPNSSKLLQAPPRSPNSSTAFNSSKLQMSNPQWPTTLLPPLTSSFPLAPLANRKPLG